MIDRSARILLLAGAVAAAPTFAADPEFKTGLVTASRVYEKPANTGVSISGVRSAHATVWTSRITVAVDGWRVTAEWEPETTISETAKDFPRGTDVAVASRRNQLVLKVADGSTVTARIVDRKKADTGIADQRRD